MSNNTTGTLEQKKTNSPLFLMFGRHPRLAVDAYLGLNSPEEPEVRSKEHYATKLKKHLQLPIKLLRMKLEKVLTDIKDIMT